MNTILVDCALVLFMRRSCFLFLFLSLSCFLVSHFFTLTDQFTDDDAPPLPWSVESDEQIIVAKTEGFPHLLLLLFCFVLSLLQGLLWSCLSFKSLVPCLFLLAPFFFPRIFCYLLPWKFFFFPRIFCHLLPWQLIHRLPETRSLKWLSETYFQLSSFSYFKIYFYLRMFSGVKRL